MPETCGCPADYTYNPATGLCELVVNGGFEVGGDIKTIPAICQDGHNMINGTVIYPTITPIQFPLTGQTVTSFLDILGTSLTPASSILSGSLWISGGSTSAGLLNIRGVGLPTPTNTWYGTVGCINVIEGHSTNFAITAKTAFRLYIDGVLAILHQPGSPAQVNQYLHIFPITLSAGQHSYRVEGLCSQPYNCPINTINQAAGSIYFEIYDNVTAASLSLITSVSTLDALAVQDFIHSPPTFFAGTQFYVSSVNAFAAYYCPSGSTLQPCGVGLQGAFVCPITYTQPFVPCCYNLVECTTGAIIKTTNDLSGSVGKIIKISEFAGCYLITISTETPCLDAIPVTVSSTYLTCITCNTVYYELTDCVGGNVSIITKVNLAAYVGQVIKISGYNNTCWIVTVSPEVSETIIITVVNSFATCVDCLPPPPKYNFSLADLKLRSVQPGYNVGECSPEFVEKVNCNFAQQIFGKLLKQKYGVNACLNDDFDKYYIKKQLLDLNLIYDSNFCQVEQIVEVCPVIEEVIVYSTVNPTAPVNITTSVTVDNNIYPPPVINSVQIIYQ